MITSLASLVFRAIPEEAKAGLANGTLRLFGSVIRRDDGSIAYHLQEAAPLAQMAAGIGAGRIPIVDQVLEIAGLVQNELIRQGVAEVEEAIGSLLQFSVANLALSGVGIGVSVAGFALMQRKLSSIEGRIATMEAGMADLSNKLEKVREEQDRQVLSHVLGLVRLFEESWELTDAGRAESSWRRVYQDGAELQELMLDRAANTLNRRYEVDAAEPHLDAFALVTGLRIAALLASDEIGTARRIEERSTSDLFRLTGPIGLSDLVRRAMSKNAEIASQAWELARAEHMTQLRPLVFRMRHRENLLATQTAIAPLLAKQGVRPREWFQLIRQEQEAPVLLVADPAPVQQYPSNNVRSFREVPHAFV